jgi:hypothetical protein
MRGYLRRGPHRPVRDRFLCQLHCAFPSCVAPGACPPSGVGLYSLRSPGPRREGPGPSGDDPSRATDVFFFKQNRKDSLAGWHLWSVHGPEITRVFVDVGVKRCPRTASPCSGCQVDALTADRHPARGCRRPAGTLDDRPFELVGRSLASSPTRHRSQLESLYTFLKCNYFYSTDCFSIPPRMSVYSGEPVRCTSR